MMEESNKISPRGDADEDKAQQRQAMLQQILVNTETNEPTPVEEPEKSKRKKGSRREKRNNKPVHDVAVIKDSPEQHEKKSEPLEQAKANKKDGKDVSKKSSSRREPRKVAESGEQPTKSSSSSRRERRKETATDETNTETLKKEKSKTKIKHHKVDKDKSAKVETAVETIRSAGDATENNKQDDKVKVTKKEDDKPKKAKKSSKHKEPTEHVAVPTPEPGNTEMVGNDIVSPRKSSLFRRTQSKEKNAENNSNIQPLAPSTTPATNTLVSPRKISPSTSGTGKTFGLFKKKKKEVKEIDTWAAVRTENTERLEQLILENNELVHHRNENNATLLHEASEKGNCDMIILLMKHNASLEVTDKGGATPLIRAVRSSCLEAALMLIEHSANINARDLQDCTALHWAVQVDNLELVQAILQKPECDVQALAKFQATALHLCAKNSTGEIASLLLRANVPVDALTTQKYTALHMATLKNNVPVIKTLVNASTLSPSGTACNINFRTRNGQTSLHLAVIKNYTEAIVALVESQCSCNAYDAKRYIPLHWAAKMGHLAATKALIETAGRQRVNLDAPDQVGRTPLHRAVQSNKRDLVQYLLNSGAKFSVLDKWEAPPQFYAEREGYHDIVMIFRTHIEKLHQRQAEEQRERFFHTKKARHSFVASGEVNVEFQQWLSAIQQTQQRRVDLGQRNWSVIPTQLPTLTQLEVLHLQQNQLSTLPNDFGKLNQLTLLDLSSNKFIELPKVVGTLPNLTKLLLQHNQLFDLPSNFKKVSKLEHLELDHNRFPTFPEAILTIGSPLQVLHLGNNMIEHVPSAINRLAGLVELHLEFNKLTTLSPNIGFLVSLRVLSVHHNKLTRIPPEIGKLYGLAVFNCSDNPLVFPTKEHLELPLHLLLAHLRTSLVPEGTPSADSDDESYSDDDKEDKRKSIHELTKGAGPLIRNTLFKKGSRRTRRSKSFEASEGSQIYDQSFVSPRAEEAVKVPPERKVETVSRKRSLSNAAPKGNNAIPPGRNDTFENLVLADIDRAPKIPSKPTDLKPPSIPDKPTANLLSPKRETSEKPVVPEKPVIPDKPNNDSESKTQKKVSTKKPEEGKKYSIPQKALPSVPSSSP